MPKVKDILDRLESDEPADKAEWVTREGDVLTIAEMTPLHRVNLLRWLERNAGTIKISYEYRMLQFMSGPLGPSGDMATLAVDQAFDRLLEEHPRTWLYSLPFVKTLARQVEKDNKQMGMRVE